LSLAAVGIYGVISYAVTRRTSEMGIRLALGAAPGTIRAMIVRESLPPIVIGGICGSIGAWSFTQLLDGFLFGVKPMDAWSVAGALGVLTAVALLAAIIPALRASRVTPMKALRYE
jgi:putative ABC transport system permease protein